MRINVLCGVALLAATSLFADRPPIFLKPVDNEFLKTANDIVAITVSGDSITGDISMTSMVGSSILKVGIKDASGTKHKFVPEDLTLLKWKMSKMARVYTMVDNATECAINTPYKYLHDQGYAVWDKVPDPEKSGNAFLLQVLNPTYSSVLKVYALPKAMSATIGGVAIGSNSTLADEYIIVKGSKSYLLEKKSYRKTGFADLFSDRPDFVGLYPAKEIDWDDLPKHIFAYTALVSPK